MSKLYDCFNHSQGLNAETETFIETLFKSGSRINAIKKSGNGVILRNILDSSPGSTLGGAAYTESLDDLSVLEVVPGSYWHNAIGAMNMVYPSSTKQNGWSVPIIFAAAYGGNCNVTSNLLGGESLVANSANWTNIYKNEVFGKFESWNDLSLSRGVYYINDSNSVDNRGKLVNQYTDVNVYDAYYTDNLQNNNNKSGIEFNVIRSTFSQFGFDKQYKKNVKGSGGYKAGACSKLFDTSCGGGTGLHVYSPNPNGSGSSIVQWDTNFSYNYGQFDGSIDSSLAEFNFNDKSLIIDSINSTGLYVKAYFAAGNNNVAEGCGLDCVANWVQDFMSLIILQNSLWLNRNITEANTLKQLGKTSDEAYSYWGWNEVPIPKQSLGKINYKDVSNCYEFGWDALVIYLPMCKGANEYLNWPRRSTKPSAPYKTESNYYALDTNDVSELLNHTNFINFRLNLYQYLNRIVHTCFNYTLEYMMDNSLNELQNLGNKLKFILAYQYDTYVKIDNIDTVVDISDNNYEKMFQRYFFNLKEEVSINIYPWELNMYGYNSLYTPTFLDNSMVAPGYYSFPQDRTVTFILKPDISNGYCNIDIKFSLTKGNNNLVNQLNKSLDRYDRLLGTPAVQNDLEPLPAPNFMDVDNKGRGLMVRQIFDAGPNSAIAAGVDQCNLTYTNSYDDNPQFNCTPGTYLHNFTVIKNPLYPSASAGPISIIRKGDYENGTLQNINYEYFNNPIIVAVIAGGVDSSENNTSTNWNRIFKKDTFGKFNHWNNVIEECNGVFYPHDSNSVDNRAYWDTFESKFLGWSKKFNIHGKLIHDNIVYDPSADYTDPNNPLEPYHPIKCKNGQQATAIRGSGALKAGANNGGGTGRTQLKGAGNPKDGYYNLGETLDTDYVNKLTHELTRMKQINASYKTMEEIEDYYNDFFKYLLTTKTWHGITLGDTAIDFWNDLEMPWLRDPLNMIACKNAMWKNRFELFNYKIMGIEEDDNNSYATAVTAAIDNCIWGWTEVPLEKNILGNNKNLQIDTLMIFCNQSDILNSEQAFAEYLESNMYFWAQFWQYYSRYYYLWDNIKFVFATQINTNSSGNKKDWRWQKFCFVPKEKEIILHYQISDSITPTTIYRVKILTNQAAGYSKIVIDLPKNQAFMGPGLRSNNELLDAERVINQSMVSRDEMGSPFTNFFGAKVNNGNLIIKNKLNDVDIFDYSLNAVSNTAIQLDGSNTYLDASFNFSSSNSTKWNILKSNIQNDTMQISLASDPSKCLTKVPISNDTYYIEHKQTDCVEQEISANCFPNQQCDMGNIVNNLSECKAFCDNLADCNTFTFEKSDQYNQSKCYLRKINDLSKSCKYYSAGDPQNIQYDATISLRDSYVKNYTTVSLELQSCIVDSSNSSYIPGTYTDKYNLNCYENNGATCIGDCTYNKFITYDISSCMKICDNTANCQGVVWTEGDRQCWLRNNIDTRKCISGNNIYSTYIKQS